MSQDGFDAPAFELAAAMPVLHTLHLPPIVTAVTRAAATVAPGRLATVSQACLAAWRAAGVDVGQVLPNGVPAVALPATPIERTALVPGRISPQKAAGHPIPPPPPPPPPLPLPCPHHPPAYQ